MNLQLRKEAAIPAAIGVAALSIGIGIGYIVKKLRSNEDYRIGLLASMITDCELELLELRHRFNEHEQRHDYLVQESVNLVNHVNEKSFDEYAEDMHRAVVVPSDTEEEDDPKVINIFVDEEDDWDYTEELKNRKPDHPYIIHRDEFYSDDNEFKQTTLTYYDGDHILCDENDVPVYNQEKVVGTLKFGKGSKDPSICYIRNEAYKADYEVIIDHGSYQSEVLGYEIEKDLQGKDLKHSIHKLNMKLE